VSDAFAASRPRTHNLAGALLRSLSIAAKFLLVYDLTRHLSLAELGVFGLFTTSTVLAAFVLGLDFNVFSAREIVSQPRERRGFVVRNQLALHGVSYLAGLPLLLVFGSLGFVPWSRMGFFCWITLCSHLGLEAHRLLIALREPFAAYVVSFVGTGLWVFPVLALSFAEPRLRSLELVFAAWAAGATVAVGLGALWLRRLGALAAAGPLDWRWIARGLRTGLLFLTATLAGLLVRYADRYFIQFHLGEAPLGVYTFFASVAGIAHDLVFASFISVLLPGALASYQRGQLSDYREQVARLGRRTLVATVLLVPAFLVGIELLIWLVGKPELAASRPVFYLLLAGAAVLNLSYVPHCMLYAMRRDGSLAGAALAGAALGVLLAALLIPRLALLGAALASLVTAVCIALMKSVSARRAAATGAVA
jgi:O-antigen/teichoic acid export membrane protein